MSTLHYPEYKHIRLCSDKVRVFNVEFSPNLKCFRYSGLLMLHQNIRQGLYKKSYKTLPSAESSSETTSRRTITVMVLFTVTSGSMYGYLFTCFSACQKRAATSLQCLGGIKQELLFV